MYALPAILRVLRVLAPARRRVRVVRVAKCCQVGSAQTNAHLGRTHMDHKMSAFRARLDAQNVHRKQRVQHVLRGSH